MRLWGAGVLRVGHIYGPVLAHMVDAARHNLWGGGGSYYQVF